MPVVIYVETPTEDIGSKAIITVKSDDTNMNIPTDRVGTATIGILPRNGRYTINVITPGYRTISHILNMNCNPSRPATCSPVLVLETQVEYFPSKLKDTRKTSPI